jgi:predicted MFS family arabinose efflux permease
VGAPAVARFVDTDGVRLIATRGIRGFADGLIVVTLAAYLSDQLGYSPARIGVVVTTMLLGSAALTLASGTVASAIPRRTLLLAGAALMVATGAIYATVTLFAVILLVGFVGTMNPSGGDLSVFQPIEQSLLPRTTSEEQRSRTFAWYVFCGTLLTALGSLTAGLLSNHLELRWAFVGYALAGASAMAVYLSLQPSIEPTAVGERPQPLGESKRTVHHLAALFSLDAAGGGFAVQSLVALWLFERHGFSVANAGVLFAAMGVLSAASSFLSVRIERRIGPVRTMVFTHMPAQVLLIAAALMPSGGAAVVCLLARSLLQSMDVPVRNAYVMSVVTPGERAAAASVTNVPRSLAGGATPLLAGWMLSRSTFGWPLIIAGVMKLTYDLLLLRAFGRRDLRRS